MKYQDFKRAINKPYFSRMDILLNRVDVFGHQLSSWRKKGYLENVKKGLDVFVDEKGKVSPEEISFLLYQPSYISLESALCLFGIIP